MRYGKRANIGARIPVDEITVGGIFMYDQYSGQQLLPAPEVGGGPGGQLSLYCATVHQHVQVPTTNNFNDPELVRTLISITRDLGALEERDRRQQACEDAYRQAFCFQDGATYVLGKSGKPQRLMDFQITACYYVTPDFRFRVRPFYQLEFNVKGACPLCLSEKEFLNNKKFLSALRERTGRNVYYTCSESRTALLVRQAAQRNFQEKAVCFYAGWQKMDEHWKFFQFQKFLSHQVPGCLDVWRPLEESFSGPTFAAAAVEAYADRFGAILAPTLRGTLFLWAHVSFLSSLLSAMDSAPKLARDYFVSTLSGRL